jgi:hypothetical protein
MDGPLAVDLQRSRVVAKLPYIKDSARCVQVASPRTGFGTICEAAID